MTTLVRIVAAAVWLVIAGIYAVLALPMLVIIGVCKQLSKR